MDFLLWLHIGAAVILIGPFIVSTSAAPSAIRSGQEGLPLLRWLYRTAQLYGISTIAVFVFGVLVTVSDDDVSFNDGWLSAAMGLFLAGWLISLWVIRDQGRAVREVSEGRDAAVYAGRLAVLSGIVGLLWLAVLFLMVFQPGATGHD